MSFAQQRACTIIPRLPVACDEAGLKNTFTAINYLDEIISDIATDFVRESACFTGSSNNIGLREHRFDVPRSAPGISST